MSAFNRPVASSSTSSSNPNTSHKVRLLWKAFEETLPKSQNVLKHKISAAKGKADAEYNKTSNSSITPAQQEELKARIANDVRRDYFEKIRLQWDKKLTSAGLKAEDWTDMTPEEMEAITTTFGGGFEANSDEDMVFVNNPVPPVPQTFNNFLRPIAPSFSTSTRTSNVSSISTASSVSSYAVVNPNEFHSGEEDDLFYPVTATSHDLTDDDDDPPFIPTRNRGHTFGGWSSGDSLASSLHNSVESLSSAALLSNPVPAHPHPHRPLVSNYILQNTSHASLASASASHNNHNRLPTEDDDNIPGYSYAYPSSTSRAKVLQPYIGPHLDDPNEPQAEAEGFELFKMQTRMQKIVEFHQLAALAEIRLSIEIYNERKSTGGINVGHQKGGGDVSSRVIEHQRRMTELQKTKEDERKSTVKEERAKRRSELRGRGNATANGKANGNSNGGRPGRSNTIVAPVPSAPTNPSWLTDFQEGISPQLHSSFDLERILRASTDPTRQPPPPQQQSVEQYLRHALNLTSSSSSSAPSSPTYDSSGYGMRQGYVSSSSRTGQGQTQSQAPTQPPWSSSSSSASIHSHHAGNPFFQHSMMGSSTTKNVNINGKQKAKPSPFGEDSDEDNDDSNDNDNDREYDNSDEDDETSPPADILTQSVDPFGRTNINTNVAVADAFLESQMQQDPLLAAAMSRYGVGSTSSMISNNNNNDDDKSNSPPMVMMTSSWGTKPASTSAWGTTAPGMAMATATKDVRATPAMGGWMRKKQVSNNNLLSREMEASPPPPPPSQSVPTPFGPFESMVDPLPSSMGPLSSFIGNGNGKWNGNGNGQSGSERKFISTPMDAQAQAWEMMAEQLLQQNPMTLSSLVPNGIGRGKKQQQQQQAVSMSMMAQAQSQAPLELEESQAIWSQMVENQNQNQNPAQKKKPSPMTLSAVPPVPPVIVSTAASAAAGTKFGKGGVGTPSVATSKPVSAPVPAPAAASSTPAPAPPPAQATSKKMNKKQRQAAKKNGGAIGTSTLSVETEPTPSAAEATEVAAASEPALQQSTSLFGDDDPLAPPPHPASTPSSMSASSSASASGAHPIPVETPSLISRMMPAIGRARRDSAVSAASWEDSATINTPRPASKIPAHLQSLGQTQSPEMGTGMGTPRPTGLFKAGNGMGGASALSARRMSIDQSGMGMGTIKSSQWGSTASSQASTTNNARSLWNMFGGGGGPKPSTAGDNGMRIPGGFDAVGGSGDGGADGDGGGGGGGGGGGADEEEEEEVQTPQIWKGSASVWGKKAAEKASSGTLASQAKQQPPPLSAAAQRQRRLSEVASSKVPAPAAPAAKATPSVIAAAAAAASTRPQTIPTPQTGGKKGARAKKNAKGKKVTMEEVPDEENDSKGGSLPVDSRALLLPANEPTSPVPNVILEPKPSVAPRMFDSIIGYGDEDEEDEDGAFSSPHVATPSTAPSSPPDVFDPRLVAAMKEMQEKNAQYSQRLDGVSSGSAGFAGSAGGLFGGGGGSGSVAGWGSALAHQQQHDRWVPSAMASASTVPKTSAWGAISKDKGKGKMTDVEDSPKATLPNLKRNKPAAGWL